VIQWRGEVYIQRCHLRCIENRWANICLVFYCMRVVVVAPTVDWDGLLVWCDVSRFFHGWRHIRRGFEVWVESMICNIPGSIYYGSEIFGLGSLHDDDVGFAGATPQFCSAPLALIVIFCRMRSRVTDNEFWVLISATCHVYSEK
jgi:hypothetical protein